MTERKQKNILLNALNIDSVGGIQSYTKMLMEEIARTNNLKTISLHDSSSKCPSKLPANGSKLKFLVFNLFHQVKADVVLWNHVSLSPIMLIMKLIFINKTHILITYGTEIWKKDIAFYKKLCILKFDRYITISNFTKNKMLKKYNISEDLIQIIPPAEFSGSSHRTFDKPSGLVPEHNGRKIELLTILRLEKSEKLMSIVTVAKCAHILTKDYNIPTIIHVVGDGKDRDFIVDILKDNKLYKYCTFHGFVANKKPFFDKSDFFVLTSRGEGFGIVFLEAILNGLLCVGARECGTEDIIQHGKTGFLVEFNSAEELSKVIRQSISDQETAHAMRQSAFRHCVSNFDRNVVAKKIRSFLKEL